MPPTTIPYEMQALPEELVADIQDMACRKLHNGSPSRFGLIVVVDVDFSFKIEGALERALEGWVWDSLDRAHRALDFEVCWRFVGNVLHDQWEDKAYEDYLVQHFNWYQVCVNIKSDVCGDAGDNGLFPYAPEHISPEPVDPASVLEHFTSSPSAVRGVAISGVNQNIVRDQWAECIAQESHFDRAGKGFMLHPMWTLAEQAQDGTFPRLTDVRERSFNFGWPDYPGQRGEDW